jgi:hypothetical protein
MDLRLDTVGPGLGGKVVRCASCKASASLEGCFGRDALKRVGLNGCEGRTPWLGSARTEPCVRQARVAQRGASNIYYGCIESSLDIPPFSADLTPIFGRHWNDFQEVDPHEWPDLIRIHKLEAKSGHPKEVLLRILHEWKAADEADEPNSPLELAEYVKFREAGLNKINVGEFQTQPGVVPDELGETVASVVQATRLREVRAQTGFTRIHPPGGDFGKPAQKKGAIYIQKKDWLPAVELRGEGIFLRLQEGEKLTNWEGSDDVKARVERFLAPLGVIRTLAGQQREGEPTPPAFAARFVLLHSLAHALIRRLSLDCGYSSSALRERLYVGVDPQPMCGLLIHTGAPDSEGTLGGLVRQGTPERLWGTFKGALKEMSWCSSDPVCITGTATLSSLENGAACHACLLVPETSCQHFNRFLDRALLVGTPNNPGLGFFRSVLEQSVL